MDLFTFLKAHKRTPDSKPTHTRIPDKKHRVFGGSWTIPDDKLDQFYELYHKHVCVNGKPEYLTELQRRDNTACLYLDLDFRYEPSVTKRRHEQQHAFDVMETVCATLTEFIEEPVEFKAYVWERPDCVPLEEVTKDGIHIATTLTMDHKVQQVLRKRLIAVGESLLGDLPLTNKYEDVFDNSISTGSTGTQMPFSSKPGRARYEPVVVYQCAIDPTAEEMIDIDEIELPSTMDILRDTSTRCLATKAACSYRPAVYDEYKASFENTIIREPIERNDCGAPIDYDATHKKMLRISLEKLESTTTAAGIILNYAHTGDLRILDMLQEVMSKARNYDAEWVQEHWDSYDADKHSSYNIGMVVYKSVDPTLNYAKFNALGKVADPDLSKCDEDLSNLEDLKQEARKRKEKARDDFIQEHYKKEIALAYVRQREYFEQFVFKIGAPISFGIVAYGEVRMEKASNVKTLLMPLKTPALSKRGELTYKSFFDKWLEDVLARMYNQVDFRPFPRPCPDHIFNTFTGLLIEETDASVAGDRDTSLFHEMVRSLTGYDADGYNYMMNYLAHIVQRPGELPRTSMVFRGEQGIGKNVFWEFFGEHIIGRDHVLSTADIDKVIGRFNMLPNKLLIILDEMNGRDGFGNSDKLKNIITAPSLAWEKKGFDGVTVNNCGRYIFLTNNDTPVKIEQSDRRFVVFDASSKYRNNADFFCSLVDAFETPSKARAFYDELCARDISKWNPIADRPITEATREVASVTIPVLYRFMEHIFMSMETEVTEHPSRELFDIYTAWCEASRFNAGTYTNIQKFGREMTKLANAKAVEKRTTKRGAIYVFEREVLKPFLIDTGLLEDYSEDDGEL